MIEIFFKLRQKWARTDKNCDFYQRFFPVFRTLQKNGHIRFEIFSPEGVVTMYGYHQTNQK